MLGESSHAKTGCIKKPLGETTKNRQIEAEKSCRQGRVATRKTDQERVLWDTARERENTPQRTNERRQFYKEKAFSA